MHENSKAEYAANLFDDPMHNVNAIIPIKPRPVSRDVSTIFTAEAVCLLLCLVVDKRVEFDPLDVSVTLSSNSRLN